MECISGNEGAHIRPTPALPNRPGRGQHNAAGYDTAPDATDALPLHIVALILQHKLTLARVANVVDLPRWRVRQECIRAIDRLRQAIAADQSS